MSDSELQQWKKKAKKLALQLEEKHKTIQEYKQVIEQSNNIIKKIMDQLTKELKLANQMHRILLPVDLPVIPNCEFSFKFRPAEEDHQGKDFYEITPQPQQKCFNIIMSSSPSYSMSSLLFSTRLKIMGQSHTLDKLLPHEFIIHLFEESQKDQTTAFLPPKIPLQEVTKTNDKKFSATNKKHTTHAIDLFSENINLFYASVNQKTYNMSYCLLGNITMFVQSKETSQINIFSGNSSNNTPSVHLASTSDPSNKPLSKKSLTSQTIALNSKDRVVICSSGIFNCQDPSGQKYPVSILKQILKAEPDISVHELRNRIVYDLDRFCQGRPRTMDQSILVMEIKDRILKLTTNK